MNCRHCAAPLIHNFLDLGHAPPSNAYLCQDDLSNPETYYPLRVKVCDQCWLVQTEDFTNASALFSSDYAYFSSTSTGWLNHAERYVATAIKDLRLDTRSYVIEIACNDGYLLRNFLSAQIPCLGIEPTASTAQIAERLGIPVVREFFCEEVGQRLARQRQKADLLVGNNVYAHVPNINDFTRGLKAVLKSSGTITLEFPHLMRLIEGVQFDTVYHEHFSYLSLHSVVKIFADAGLRVWRVEELPTHGGSLRVYGCHSESERRTEASVELLLRSESDFGIQHMATYSCFQPKVDKIKNDLLAFLIDQFRLGKKVAGYGAAAKGNTLLNYAGVKTDLISYICDAAPSKQFMYMPGSHIPIVPPDYLLGHPPDIVVILPWNIASEILSQNATLLDRGVQFMTAVPELKKL
jgi:hypothetical protein